MNITSPTGASLAWTEYQPFGVVRTAGASASAPTLPFAYAGEYLDAAGLYNLRAREYDPTSGRFLAIDPVVAPVGDPYVSSSAYVRNNPVTATDPSGACGEKPTPQPGPPPPPLPLPRPVDPDKAARCYLVHLATAEGSAALAEIEGLFLRAHAAAGPIPIAQLILLVGDVGVGVSELLLLANAIEECW